MGTRAGIAVGDKAEHRVQLRVLYDFEYEYKGRQVSIRKDEKLLLVCKTNTDWWQVVRPGECESSFVPENSTFFVPASYVAQEDSLPHGTRFYVEREKMEEQQGKTNESSRKGHDSFRNVLKKFSGGSSVPEKSEKKPSKPQKPVKGSRKNSDSSESNKFAKKDHNEVSTFGMCFGKSTEARVQNPFVEELEHAIGQRQSHKRNQILDTKLSPPTKDQDSPAQESALQPQPQLQKTETAHERWEKSIAQALKKSEQFNSTSARVVEDFEEKHRKEVKKDDFFDSIKLRSVSSRLEIPKKPPRIIDPKPKALEVEEEEIVDHESNNHVEILEDQQEKAVVENNNAESKDSEPENETEKSEVERLLTDRRKMWAIETLMAELMESSGKSRKKSTSVDDKDNKGSSGPNKLVQELHDMSVSREIQVNLPEDENDNINCNDVNATETDIIKMDSEKKVFDFPPRSPSLITRASSPTARSPKQFDEYNEANILGDEALGKTVIVGSIRKKKPNSEVPIIDSNNLCNDQLVLKSKPPPSPPPGCTSSANVSLRAKRNKAPLRMKIAPGRDFFEERFLASGRHSSETRSSEKHSLDLDILDSTIASLSHDSLRLYKRRSKSDTALNIEVCSNHNNQTDVSPNPIPGAQIQSRSLEINKERRKYTQKTEFRGPLSGRQHEFSQNPRRVREKLSSVGRSDRVVSPATRYKLSRKSKSLGDLDSPDAEDEQLVVMGPTTVNLKRRYKPVPKLRNKESLKKPGRPNLPPPPSPVRSADTQLTKPVPAKRRVFPSPPVLLPENGNTADDSCDDFGEIDIELSTAVGFKALLRASESGSEEFLQYKTFPTKGCSSNSVGANKEYGPGIFRSDGNVNLSGKTLSVDITGPGTGIDNVGGTMRSLSDEMILKSAVSSVSAGLSTLDDTWTTCSSPTQDEGSAENLNLPPGWTQTYDNMAKRACYVNNRGDKWFSSSDSEGKIYFFEENSNESSWALPPVISPHRTRLGSNGEWPQLFDGNMHIIKEGPINKTKIMSENGKKFRKNWTTSYAVLTELFLLFFKDAKTFAAMKMDQSVTQKPDISVDLNGASIESADRLSNRKNVYLISTLLGLQVLIQWDSPTGTAEWYHEIHSAIQKLPFSQEYRKSVPLRE